jgi:hypothetical protein
MRDIIRAGLALLAIGVAGCPPPPVEADGFKLNAEQWQIDKEKLTTRAAFDTKCPKDQLKLTVLVADPGLQFSGGGEASQVGVTACGQSVTYVHSPSGWVANAQSEAKPTPK